MSTSETQQFAPEQKPETTMKRTARLAKLTLAEMLYRVLVGDGEGTLAS